MQRKGQGPQGVGTTVITTLDVTRAVLSVSRSKYCLYLSLYVAVLYSRTAFYSCSLFYLSSLESLTQYHGKFNPIFNERQSPLDNLIIQLYHKNIMVSLIDSINVQT